MAKQQELPYDTKLVLTLVLLFVLYPVGLIMMFKWMNWPTWLKVIISLPVLFFILLMVGAFLVGITGNLRTKEQLNERMIKSEVNFFDENNKNTCTKQCAASSLEMDICVQKCLQNLNKTK